MTILLVTAIVILNANIRSDQACSKDILLVRHHLSSCHVFSFSLMRQCTMPVFFTWPSQRAIQEDQVHYTIQAVHLFPMFWYGHTTELLPPSVTRCKSENDEDGVGTMWACTFFNTLD